MPFIAIALFLAIAFGGGAAVAAEDAHPGDALYSVKTEINAIDSTIQGSLGINASLNSMLDATTTAEALHK